MLNPEKILELYRKGGPLSQVIPHFELRPAQEKMVQNVVSAFNNNEIALVEAGTGTGKSLAYLIPAAIMAMQEKCRIVISTRTIHLQEQLLLKDIPLVQKTLQSTFKAVLVKGMGNYLCLRKLHDSQAEIDYLPLEEKNQLETITGWTESTVEGSKSELPFSPPPNVWERVNAESETCTRRQCPHYEACFFFKARKEAESASLLIVNHSLLFTDLALRDEKEEATLLPSYEHVILDEAHHIEDVATECFAKRSSRNGVMRIFGRIASEGRGKELGRLPLLKQQLIQLARKCLQKEIEALLHIVSYELHNRRRDAIDALQSFFDAVGFFSYGRSKEGDEGAKLRLLPETLTHPDWKEVVEKGDLCSRSLGTYIEEARSFLKSVLRLDNAPFQTEVQGIIKDIQSYLSSLEKECEFIKSYVQEPKEKGAIRWIEQRPNSTPDRAELVEALLDVTPFLIHNFFLRFRTFIITSATLTAEGRFGFFRDRVGLNSTALIDRQIKEMILESPFHFSEQALFVTTSDMPEPNEKNFIDQAVLRIIECVTASRGQAFVLFTSYSMMKQCYSKLENRLLAIGCPPMKQGDAMRHALLTQFKSTPRAVLFGTDSFWEGVDVVGEALRLVIIVKLPFRVPTEPLIQARTELLTSLGFDPFTDYMLPQAIVKFKQGFGRLIRHHNDRGVVVILDKRVLTKGYGKKFIKSLPPVPHVSLKESELKNTLEQFYKKTERRCSRGESPRGASQGFQIQ